METVEVDLCAIGGGSGGRTFSARAVALGASTLLIEKERMGGDCLNYGCVPSKALLGAAHLVRRMRSAPEFGIEASLEGIDAKRVFRHVHETIARIEPYDSAEYFSRLGVRVAFGPARFVSRDELVAGNLRVRARKFVISTGSSARIPDIPGIDLIPFLTNRDVFDLQEIPRHLVIIGGGPIGVELAQAFANLGSRVTVVEALRLLGRDDPQLVDVLRKTLREDGVEILEGTRVLELKPLRNGGVLASVARDDHVKRVTGSHLLVATGRRPNIEGLGLENAGVEFSRHGIHVNEILQTSNPAIYAIGDVVGPPYFTHLAVHHADIVARNLLLDGGATLDARALPWVTFTAPELARVGMLESEARDLGLPFTVASLPYSRSDRALAERNESGFLKVIVGNDGEILGAGAIGPAAGEIIQKWAMAIHFRISMKQLAEVITPYPTSGYLDWKLARGYDVEHRLRAEAARSRSMAGAGQDNRAARKAPKKIRA